MYFATSPPGRGGVGARVGPCGVVFRLRMVVTAWPVGRRRGRRRKRYSRCRQVLRPTQIPVIDPMSWRSGALEVRYMVVCLSSGWRFTGAGLLHRHACRAHVKNWGLTPPFSRWSKELAGLWRATARCTVAKIESSLSLSPAAPPDRDGGRMQRRLRSSQQPWPPRGATRSTGRSKRTTLRKHELRTRLEQVGSTSG